MIGTVHFNVLLLIPNQQQAEVFCLFLILSVWTEFINSFVKGRLLTNRVGGGICNRLPHSGYMRQVVCVPRGTYGHRRDVHPPHPPLVVDATALGRTDHSLSLHSLCNCLPCQTGRTIPCSFLSYFSGGFALTSLSGLCNCCKTGRTTCTTLVYATVLLTGLTAGSMQLLCRQDGPPSCLGE